MSNKVREIGVASQIGLYSDAIEVGANKRWPFTSGTPGFETRETLPADIEGQAELASKNITRPLDKARMTTADIMKVTSSLTRSEDVEGYVKVRKHFLGDTRPVFMLSVVNQLIWPGVLVEIEVIAAQDIK